MIDPYTSPEVSVIIPCLNEANTIKYCIETAQQSMREHGIRGEIIVSDNGSIDDSVDIALACGAMVVHAASKGYGYAIIRGMQSAQGRYLVMGDGDGTYDFNSIPAFIEPLRREADMVMGTRLKGDIEPGAMPFLNRYLGTPVLTGLINLFFHTKISDVNCGLRSLTKKAFTQMHLRAGGMELASEMVIKAALQKLRLVEIPTSLACDRRGRPPHLRPFRDGWRHLRFMLLFAPTWLFIIPGLTLLSIGCFVLGTILYIDIKSLGVFTMLFGQGLTILGTQVIFLGLAACGYSHLKSLVTDTSIFGKFIGWLSLEKGIIVGSIMTICGLTLCTEVFFGLLRYMSEPSNIGRINLSLSEMGILGTTVTILGVQTIFSSFYLGMFAVQVVDEDVPEDERN